jgi:hypothetical protein
MTWSNQDLDRAVRAYSEDVLVAARYRELVEVTAFLVNRDIVQESIEQGLPLSDEQRDQVEAADARLIDLRSGIARRFPKVFEDRGAPPEYWWWHLDAGPRERRKALAAHGRQPV